MNSLKICKYTVMDTSFPGIEFDSNGVSNLYWDFQKNIKPFWNPNKKSLNDLNKVIDKIKLDPDFDRDDYGNITRIQLSAKTGDGIEFLKQALVEHDQKLINKRNGQYV